MDIVRERVVLTRTRKADLPFLKHLWNDGRVMRWAGLPNGAGDTDESILAWFHQRGSEARFHHFIVRDADGEPCGEVCCGVNPGTRRAGLDVKFTPGKQGKGLATDALSALIDEPESGHVSLKGRGRSSGTR